MEIVLTRETLATATKLRLSSNFRRLQSRGKLARRENSAAARDCSAPWYASAIGGRYSGGRRGRGRARPPPASGNRLPKGSWRWQSNCGSNQARHLVKGRRPSAVAGTGISPADRHIRIDVCGGRDNAN